MRFCGVLTQMRFAFPTAAETLDMDNPENLEILKILVQTNAVRFGVPFCIHLILCACATAAHVRVSHI